MAYRPHQIGFDSEVKVCQEMIDRGFELLVQRWRTPMAEVDLVFREPGRKYFCLVEVKTLSRSEWSRFRLGFSQKQRLRKALFWCQRYSLWPVEMQLALVSRSSIHWIKQFLS